MMRNLFLSMACLPVLVACNGNGSLRVDGRIAESTAAQGTPSTQGLSLGNGTLVIERARVAVSEIELEGGGEDDLEAELGAAVVDLALDGQPTTVKADSVEAGSYHTLGMELRAGGSDDFGGAQPASIIVDGTYGGSAFSYRSAVSPELEFKLSPEVEVPEGGEASVAVTFDIAQWFTATDGSLLDPTDVAGRAAIESNISASLAAHAEVEDGDDGSDDD